MTDTEHDPYASVGPEVTDLTVEVVETIISKHANLDSVPAELIAAIFSGLSMTVAALMANAVESGKDRATIESGFAEVIRLNLDAMLNAGAESQSRIIVPH